MCCLYRFADCKVFTGFWEEMMKNHNQGKNAQNITKMMKIIIFMKVAHSEVILPSSTIYEFS